jgi:ATP-dependent Clp protease adapter protein ClpS
MKVVDITFYQFLEVLKNYNLEDAGNRKTQKDCIKVVNQYHFEGKSVCMFVHFISSV